MEYIYITSDNLENRQKYNYSKFGGKDFLKAYVKSRSVITEHIAGDSNKHITKIDLNLILDAVNGETFSEKLSEFLDQYVKTFEVRKRVYSEYNEKFKPIEEASYLEYENYILLARCCAKMYTITKCTKYLSCMLKIDDALISIKDKLGNFELLYLREILKMEQIFVEQLAKNLGVEL